MHWHTHNKEDLKHTWTIGIVYCSSVQKHLTVFEDIRTARTVVCYLVYKRWVKKLRVCEVTRVVGQLSIVCSRSQVVVL